MILPIGRLEMSGSDVSIHSLSSSERNVGGVSTLCLCWCYVYRRHKKSTSLEKMRNVYPTISLLSKPSRMSFRSQSASHPANQPVIQQASKPAARSDKSMNPWIDDSLNWWNVSQLDSTKDSLGAGPRQQKLQNFRPMKSMEIHEIRFANSWNLWQSMK